MSSLFFPKRSFLTAATFWVLLLSHSCLLWHLPKWVDWTLICVLYLWQYQWNLCANVVSLCFLAVGGWSWLKCSFPEELTWDSELVCSCGKWSCVLNYLRLISQSTFHHFHGASGAFSGKSQNQNQTRNTYSFSATPATKTNLLFLSGRRPFPLSELIITCDSPCCRYLSINSSFCTINLSKLQAVPGPLKDLLLLLMTMKGWVQQYRSLAI